MAITGCQAFFQGTRRQITHTCELPSRYAQGTLTVPGTIPTAASTVRGTHGIEQLKALEQGAVREVENMTAGSEHFTSDD